MYPSEEHDTIGAKYYLSTGKENPFCREYLHSFRKSCMTSFNDASLLRHVACCYARNCVYAHLDKLSKCKLAWYIISDILCNVYVYNVLILCQYHILSMNPNRLQVQVFERRKLWSLFWILYKLGFFRSFIIMSYFWKKRFWICMTQYFLKYFLSCYSFRTTLQGFYTVSKSKGCWIMGPGT